MSTPHSPTRSSPVFSSPTSHSPLRLYNPSIFTPTPRFVPVQSYSFRFPSPTCSPSPTSTPSAPLRFPLSKVNSGTIFKDLSERIDKMNSQIDKAMLSEEQFREEVETFCASVDTFVALHKKHRRKLQPKVDNYLCRTRKVEKDYDSLLSQLRVEFPELTSKLDPRSSAQDAQESGASKCHKNQVNKSGFESRTNNSNKNKYCNKNNCCDALSAMARTVTTCVILVVALLFLTPFIVLLVPITCVLLILSKLFSDTATKSGRHSRNIRGIIENATKSTYCSPDTTTTSTESTEVQHKSSTRTGSANSSPYNGLLAFVASSIKRLWFAVSGRDVEMEEHKEEEPDEFNHWVLPHCSFPFNRSFDDDDIPPMEDWSVLMEDLKIGLASNFSPNVERNQDCTHGSMPR